MREASAAGDDADSDVSVEPMVAVYRHDVHKLRSRAHEHAAECVHGVPVNEPVPAGADVDAALLSRPRGDPEQTVDAHASWRRLSLLTGEPVSPAAADASLRELLRFDDADQLHAAWLSASLPAAFSESPYYPYTSVKYHTVLAAALLDNYRAGAAFEDLWLAVTRSGNEGGAVVPHRTVLATSAFTLHVTRDPDGRPAARLGAVPARSFADVWSRLPEIPFDVAGSRRWRVLDAQLRRIRSWSAALQFIEEYVAAFTPAQPVGRDGSTDGGERR
ncbi:hypothetical protein [Halolamina sp. CBA1230]|uniref:hypothetical protein n=1 Tax=Halolamina sp. CBA1230 TaxID=1853690 RepID=UPI0009A22242